MRKIKCGIRTLLASCLVLATIIPQLASVSEAYFDPLRTMAKESGQQKVLVTKYRFTGEIIFTEKELMGLLADGIGKELTLADLERQTARITRYFREHGFLAAFAFLPEQDFIGGVAEIAVQIGRYDQVIIRNESSMLDAVIRREMGDSLRSGNFIRKQELEKAIWLIGDLSGVEAKASLEPGRFTGTANLIMTVKSSGKAVSGSVAADNFGSRYTGKNQLSLGTSIRNAANIGDLFNFRILRSEAALSSGNLSYLFPVFSQGDKLGVSYAKMYYTLGQEYAELNATGQSGTTSLFWNHNLVRSSHANLYTQIRYDDKRLTDRIESAETETRKKAYTVAYTLNGESQDGWGGGGSNSFSVGLTFGKLSFLTDSFRQIDASTANTGGHFNKKNLSLMRRQYLNGRLSLFTAVNAQWASKNLDSSEKLSLGGPYGVRAYSSGEVSGDEGYLASSELRWAIPLAEQKDFLQLVGFFDSGEVKLNKEKWVGSSGAERRALSGFGIGLDYSQQNNLSIRLNYAWRLGKAESELESHDVGRAWLQCVRFF